LKNSTRKRSRAVRAFAFLGAGLAVLVTIYGLVIAFPEAAFAYKTSYQNYQVWSDEPIPREVGQVLDDVTRRLRTAPLHDRAAPVKIFFCNAPWRMRVYGMHFSTRFGGVADVWLTRHVIIRASDIAANRIRPPGHGPIADARQRPLSYFIAHEITHTDVSRKYGRTVLLRYPEWLLEGYADYIGKGGDFDFDANRAQFVAGARELDRRRSGLYRGFHLKVAYLLDKKGWTLEQLFAEPPSEAQLDAWLRE
jgi:hypothetical protein